MSALKIIPATKEYIWGGNKLRNYNINSNDSNIAEAWIFSFNKNGVSTTESGAPIDSVLSEKELGKDYSNFPFFPFLIKLIDANDKLSIQVHPNDEYALANENSFGKTEMWYILEAEKDAFLYLGLNDNYSSEQIKAAIENNTICDYLNKVPVKPGDCYFVESGTIHAIGKGIVIIEIQQNSALTYRVYDFDRRDKFGNPRELHIEKALKVINYKKFIAKNVQENPLGKCKYFNVERIENVNSITAPREKGIVISFIEGKGMIDGQEFSKGNTFFIKAGDSCIIQGKYKAITTTL